MVHPSNLPKELVRHIVLYLDPVSYARAMLANKSFCKLGLKRIMVYRYKIGVEMVHLGDNKIFIGRKKKYKKLVLDHLMKTQKGPGFWSLMFIK